MIPQICIPSDLSPPPCPHEIFVARAMASYFKTNVVFVRRSNIAKSADLKIKNAIWEVKSPIGDGKRTIQNNLRAAAKQSPNIVINLARCKMPTSKAINRIQHELHGANGIKRLLVIHKNGRISVMK